MLTESFTMWWTHASETYEWLKSLIISWPKITLMNAHNQIYYQKALFGTAVCLVKSYDCIYLRFFLFIKSKTTFPCPNSSPKPTDSCTVLNMLYARNLSDGNNLHHHISWTKKKKQFLISCLDFVHCKMAPAQIRLHRFLILNLNLSFFPESCRWLRNEWQIEGITSGQNQSEQESWWHFLMRWSKRSYSCSLGFISGSYEGHRIPRSDPLCLSSRGTDDHF